MICLFFKVLLLFYIGKKWNEMRISEIFLFFDAILGVNLHLYNVV